MTTHQEISGEVAERPIVKAIIKQYTKAKERGWDRWYWTIDIHETIMGPTYNGEGDIPRTMYEGAAACLQKLSRRKDARLILGTSSKRQDIEKYLEFFKTNDIIFKYVNENPDEPSTPYADFTNKPYFSVMLEDKAGFEPEKDWKAISQVLDTLPELVGKTKTFEVAATVMRVHSPFGPHVGHEAVLSEMFDQGKHVVIFLACDQSFPSHRNPLSFEDRKTAIEKVIQKMGHEERSFSILNLPNQETNEEWAEILDNLIITHAQRPTIQNDQVALFHSRDGFGKHYVNGKGRYEVFFVREVPNVSATAIREQIGRTKVESADYLLGKIAQQQLMPVLTLNQVRLIVENDKNEFLVVKYQGRKKPVYRFIGGYFSPAKDQDFLGCLKRKVQEKSDLQLDADPSLVGTVRLTDWRHRESGASIQCIVYKIKLAKGVHVAPNENYKNEKIESIGWVAKDDLKELLHPEELPLLNFV